LELNDLTNTVLKKHSDLKAGKEVQRNDLDRKGTQYAVGFLILGQQRIVRRTHKKMLD
jgi:hypothetical protein